MRIYYIKHFDFSLSSEKTLTKLERAKQNKRRIQIQICLI